MRAVTISVAIFLNLILFGMCGYIYLLWSQYLINLNKRYELSTLSYDDQIYFYNRGYLPTESSNYSSDIDISETKLRNKHSVDRLKNVVYIKHGRPRLPMTSQRKLELDITRFRCMTNESHNSCDIKTSEFKKELLRELENVFTEESNVLKNGNIANPYKVFYKGHKENFKKKTSQKVMCELKDAKLKTIRRSEIQPSNLLKFYMPRREFSDNKHFNSCVVVSSAGALRNSNLGPFIDSHEIVLRFNHAPTRGFEQDVGAKTSIKVLNSQVVTKSEFNFLKSPLYKNVTIVLWDPSTYSSTLDEWLKNPEYNLFPNFIQYRKQESKPRVFIVNPLSIWDVWDVLQRNLPNKLRKNPPSSGFLGIRLLLPLCNFVDVVEYIPSTRVTKRCHYYDPDENQACTFGVWHPLAAEKLLTYYLNKASDWEVFQKGFVRLKGFRHLDC